MEGAHPAFVAALAHDDDVASASFLGGGAVAGIPGDGDSVGSPGVVAAALLGEEGPRLASCLVHFDIQTQYRILGLADMLVDVARVVEPPGCSRARVVSAVGY